MRLIAIVLLSLSLSGCALRHPRLNGDYQLNAKSGESLVVLSTRVDDQCPRKSLLVAIVTEHLSGSKLERDSIMLTNTFVRDDFTDPPGNFHTLRFKAGELRFTKLSNAPGGVAERELDLRLRIEPGKVYYVGELFVTVNCLGFDARINDQRRRDAALFDSRMKNVKSSLFEYRLLGV